MIKRKSTKKYFFTVEGETEKWYLEWLRDRINECEEAACNGSQAHRKNYITSLNQAYGEKFENMDEYKHEDNFKRCLGKLSVDNVRDAIVRANHIMARNQENGYCLYEYKGYKYYKENPSLAINEIIGKILKECELI